MGGGGELTMWLIDHSEEVGMGGVCVMLRAVQKLTV